MSPRWPIAVLLAVAVLVLVGCQKEEPPPPGGPPPRFSPPQPPAPIPEEGPQKAGKAIFNKNTCYRCHTIGAAQGGPGVPGGPHGAPPHPGAKGPDLAGVGSRPGRDVEGIMAFLDDPHKENPSSRMPPVKHLEREEMRALAEFLASLK